MRIYLDHNATTPLRPRVVEAMTAALREEFGNPSSVYEEGAAARAQIEAARQNVADLIGANPSEIRFTAGATEANNTVLFGLLSDLAGARSSLHTEDAEGGPSAAHVVTSAVEHPSVAAPLSELESRGLRVTRVAPDADGCVLAADIESAIEPETRLVSLIWANNETGAIQPIEAVAEICRERGLLFHVDATQALGKVEIDLAQVPIDLLACSAHKIGGPKGVGALVTRGDAEVPSFLRGGGQERGLRGGTENVVGIHGFGQACAALLEEGAAERERARKLRDRLWEGISGRIDAVRWNGDPERTLPNTLNVEFCGAAGEVLLQALDLEGVAVSAGAACHSGSVEPSEVLLAMGRTPAEARASLRLSVGLGVDDGQIDRVVSLLSELVPRVLEREAP